VNHTMTPSTPPPVPAAPQQPVEAAKPPTLKPPRVMLMGAPGSGKTMSIGTLAKHDITIWLLATEVTSVPAVVKSFQMHGVPIERLHYHQFAPASTGLDALRQRAQWLQTTDYEGVAKKKAGPERMQNAQLMEFYDNVMDFKCQRTGQSYGNLGLLDHKHAVVIDSLSGLNNMIRHNFCGLKPALSPGEWGVIMTHEHELIQNLVSSLDSWFIVTTHLDREKDEVTGGSIVSPAALGSKLGPKLPADFDEVIMAKRQSGGQFIWSTEEINSSVLQRSLPISNKLDPDFTQIVTAYNSVLSQVAASQPAATS
jgi:hypothetical protein